MLLSHSVGEYRVSCAPLCQIMLFSLVLETDVCVFFFCGGVVIGVQTLGFNWAGALLLESPFQPGLLYFKIKVW
jgi:hypothetical protein